MLDMIFRWIIFVVVGIAVLAGPWLFGAWEMWWFWPFVALICGGIGAVGGRLVSGQWSVVSGGGSRSLKLAVAGSESPPASLCEAMRAGCALPLGEDCKESSPAPERDEFTNADCRLPNEEKSAIGNRQSKIILWAALPFLVFACVRWGMVDVFMSAERSVLLHVTGLCVGVLVVFGMDSRLRKLLFWLVFANLLLLGIYGVVNQLGWNSALVLWVPSHPQYAGRATGSYFCPDHFAGVMEILLCMALGVIAARTVAWKWKGIAILASGIAIAGVVLSHSRGGLMTLVVIFGVAMIWSVAQWPKAMRWYLRMVAFSSALLLLIGMFYFGGEHLDRFASYGGHWGQGIRDQRSACHAVVTECEGGRSACHAVVTECEGGRSEIAGVVSSVWEALGRTSRGRMYGGATRAWLSAPWFGVGPGMHQNLWPHFAATADGDRENGVWPTQHNYYFHSYEVHNDWLQLLEEYGVVGLFLFLVPFGFVCFFFVSGIRREGRLWKQEDEGAGNEMQFVYLLSGLLALAAMSFHSLGDFNLQMPATVWVLAGILGMAFGGEIEPRNGVPD